MAHISTGTPQAHAEHSVGAAILGVMIAMGVPALIAIAGIVSYGWNAIPWLGAVVWGIVATFAFHLFSLMGKSMDMTRMDLLDLLGSMFVRPHSSASRATGFALHHMNGALLGVAWAYGVQFVNVPANWLSGLGWGIILWVLALILLTSVGGVHPAIRQHTEEDPGAAGTNFGKLTPLGSLMGHMVYGIALGLLYQNWPLA